MQFASRVMATATVNRTVNCTVNRSRLFTAGDPAVQARYGSARGPVTRNVAGACDHVRRRTMMNTDARCPECEVVPWAGMIVQEGLSIVRPPVSPVHRAAARCVRLPPCCTPRARAALEAARTA
jgi:hypothetical protein